ncbi:MAG: hypothetical protein GXP31_09335 [Kiritimatiellaeota bacterium]|nr:hypothetical protein [Kiritimatiellota bacterium]
MTQASEIDALLRRLNDYRTRAEARRRLAELSEQAAPKVLEVLVNEPHAPPNKRWALATLLGRARFEPAIPVLLDMLRNEPALRADACRALQQITGKDIGEEVSDWERALSGAADAESSDTGAPTDANPELFMPEKELIRQAFEGIATKIEWEGNPPYAYLRMPLPGERKQQIIVSFNEKDENGGDIVSIYTECGPASPATEAAAHRRNVTVQYGRFAIEQDDGRPRVVMRHSMPRLGVDPERLREVVESMARDADSFEAELTHQDRI